MATGGGYTKSRTYGTSDDHSPQRSSDYYSQNRNQSNDPDGMTLALVNEIKDIIRSKTKQNQQITEPIIELEVARIKRDKNPNQYSFNQWKRLLPREVQHCPDSILRVSMAYGSDPQQVQSVLQAKMNKINSNEQSIDTSIDNITEPLRKLQRDLENNPPPNLFHAVHNIGVHDINRADRLFLSEARHFAPAVHSYTFDDAHNAVQAIRETKYELNKQSDLILMVKTLRDVDEIRDQLKRSQNTSTHPNDSSPSVSRSTEDAHRLASPSTNNDRDRNNSNFNFSRQRMPDSYQQQNSSPKASTYRDGMPQTISRFIEDDHRSTPSPRNNDQDRNNNNANFSRQPVSNLYQQQNSSPKASTYRDDIPQTTSRFTDDNHRSAPSSRNNDQDRNNNNANFSRQPVSNLYQQQNSSPKASTYRDDIPQTTSRFTEDDHRSTPSPRNNDQDRKDSIPTFNSMSISNSYQQQNSSPKVSRDRDDSPQTTSRFPEDDHYSTPSPRSNDDNRKNNNFHYMYKPLQDPFQNSTQQLGHLPQGSDNRAKDNSRGSALHRDAERRH